MVKNKDKIICYCCQRDCVELKGFRVFKRLIICLSCFYYLTNRFITKNQVKQFRFTRLTKFQSKE